MRWPWQRRREEAERQALVAVDMYLQALDDRGHARRLAAESRRINNENGFAKAIRTAMGVDHDNR